MKKILDWIKSNPIILLSVVLALASVGGLFLVISMQSSLAGEMDKFAKKADALKRAGTTTVTIPSLEPGKAAGTINLTMNESAITSLDRIMNEIQKQSEGINQIVADFNQRPQMSEDFKLPHVPSGGAPLFRIKTTFRQAVFNLLGAPPDRNQPTTLNAGVPVKPFEIEPALREIRQDFLAAMNKQQTTQLSDADKERLRRDLQKKLLQILQDRARSINVYVEQQPADIDNIVDTTFPLDVSAMFPPNDKRTPDEVMVWDSQMALWMQQDLVHAIALANHVGKPGRSVIDGPIKRLIKVKVYPKHVGLDGEGAFKLLPGGTPPAPNTPPTLPTTDDYTRTPSGRVSNAVYDVRHIHMTAVIDLQSIPQFVNALGQVNFMSLLALNVAPHDEYAAMKEGYYYGTGDIVQAEMVIETVWFRSWTAPLMPPTVATQMQVVAPKS